MYGIDLEENPKEYWTASEKYTTIHGKLMSEREVYFKRAELRAFNDLKGDISAIVTAVKDQILSFIYVSKILAGAVPDNEERDVFKNRSAEIKEAIRHNEKLIEKYPNDVELRKNTQELKELNLESLHDSIYSTVGLRRRINESFKIYFDFLSKAEPKAYKDLQSYIDEAIKNKDNIKPINPKAPKNKVRKIETLKSILPSNYIMPNNKISNYLNKIVGNGTFEIKVSNKNKRNEVLTTVSVNYDDPNITLPKIFTAYDRVVHNAAISLYEAGNKCFTPDMIYRCMNGLTNKEKVSPQSIGAVTKSIDKARRFYCSIDYTEEAKLYNSDVEKTNVESYILAADKIEIEAGGKEVKGYKFLRKPLLYEYAQISKQVITIPNKLLQTKSVVRSTNEVIVIREYLIRRIEVMKSNNNQRNKILFEKIYEELEIENPTKEKAKKIREATKSILTYWKNEKYIKSFKEYKEGRTFKGIEIFY